MSKTFYLYILRNNSGNFYTGITNNLIKRVWQHKQKIVKGFTTKYNINKLIYFEEYSDPNRAIAREKQIKNWNRKKKNNLIVKMNPKFEEIIVNS